MGLALSLALLVLLLDIALASVLGGGPWGLPTRATTRAASPTSTLRGWEDKMSTLQRYVLMEEAGGESARFLGQLD